jgi:DNA-binding LytR/AlgR family response regulator
MKKFILRSSCHRSYFINPIFIKIVHRDDAGLIVAELKQDGFESIPISRKYQEAISRLL